MSRTLKLTTTLLAAQQASAYQLTSAYKTVEDLTPHEQRQVLTGLVLGLTQNIRCPSLTTAVSTPSRQLNRPFTEPLSSTLWMCLILNMASYKSNKQFNRSPQPFKPALVLIQQEPALIRGSQSSSRKVKTKNWLNFKSTSSLSSTEPASWAIFGKMDSTCSSETF